MEESAKGQGTVTSLSSLFPVEDAQKAAKRVEDTIAEKQQQLDHLRGFTADNTSLVNLVMKLPDHLHHDIMVPFGKAAFFPGRLVHTNEFLVLLGEGYYAERTSKQTVDILMRRGKELDSQVDSLNAVLADLKFEASFIDSTASEAAEGLVEIKEDYVEESSSDGESELGRFSSLFPSISPLKQDSPSSTGADNTKVSDEDEEYARILARMDELEKEELEAESEIVSEEEQSDNESDENKKIKVDLHQFPDHKYLHQNGKFSEESMPRKPPETKDAIAASKESFIDQRSRSGLTAQSIPEETSSRGNIFPNAMKSKSEKGLVPPKVEGVQAVPSPISQVTLQSSKPKFDDQKAFTGSIVERVHNLQIDSRNQTSATSQSSDSQPSKPVSRFRMQRK
ncbi:hypothetical protein C1H46_036596 [Malus baccata]|uniref:RNA polymerase II subunit 5-mediating protein homolog n=1 Tax=Malus baccata TaxID=106549 RepID=A0A540KUG5_MALBA|nr:hypothetical protein C1H46_036596 [Malus baccata]